MALAIYGQPLTQENITIIKGIISVGKSLHAPFRAIEAAIYAATGESDMTYETNNHGTFQTTGNPSAYDDGNDWMGQARGFYTNGTSFAYPGGIHGALLGWDAWQIANSTEDNLVWSQSRGDSYARSGFTTGMLTREATDIVEHFYAESGGDVALQGAPDPKTGQPRPPSVNNTHAPPNVALGLWQNATPSVADLNPGPVIRDAFYAMLLHGSRALDNSQDMYDHVEGITYCDTNGPN